MLRTIRLYGELGKRYGRVHKAHVSSVSEALQYLKANFKGFVEYVVDSDKRIAGYEVWDSKYNCDGVRDDFVKQGDGDIKIIPRISGSGAVARIIAGVVLIVVGCMLAPATGGSSMTLASYGSAMMIGMGASLVLGGVIELLSPKSKLSSSTDSSQSYLFTGATNSNKSDDPIMIGYGEYLVGSHVISATITTEDI